MINAASFTTNNSSSSSSNSNSNKKYSLTVVHIKPTCDFLLHATVDELGGEVGDWGVGDEEHFFLFFLPTQSPQQSMEDEQLMPSSRQAFVGLRVGDEEGGLVGFVGLLLFTQLQLGPE